MPDPLHDLITNVANTQKSMMSTQSVMFDKIDQINTRLDALIKIEGEQVNQQNAIERMGRYIDKQDLRIESLENKMVDMRIASAKLVTRVSLIGGGGGATVASIMAFIFSKISV